MWEQRLDLEGEMDGVLRLHRDNDKQSFLVITQNAKLSRAGALQQLAILSKVAF